MIYGRPNTKTIFTSKDDGFHYRGSLGHIRAQNMPLSLLSKVLHETHSRQASGYSLAPHAWQTLNHSRQAFIYALKKHKTADNNSGECLGNREPPRRTAVALPS